MTKIYIETFGCTHNVSDSEQMAGLLKEAKFEMVDKLEEADMAIFNSCTVKGPSETNLFRTLEETKQKFPHLIIIVAGCVAQTMSKQLPNYGLIGTRQIHHVVEVIEEALNENTVHLLSTDEMPPLNLPRIRKIPIIGIIPLSRGCLGACSFCKTKAARGNLQSYSIEDIKKEAEIAIKEGCKEIWLTSQDNGCYGFDLSTDLPNLLKELVKIPGEFKIRLGMMNPDHLKKIKDGLIEVMGNEKLFQFLHIPVQSGNNEVLKKMHRNYTREEFLELVQEIKKAHPSLTIATDIIVGFPEETEEQYTETQSLIRLSSPDVVNISRFWCRPKTPAEGMDQLAGEVIKHRSRVLTDICHNIFRMQNERWRDWEGEVIVDEKGKNPREWKARNFAYKAVLLEGDFKLGDKVKVKIVRTTIFDLVGKVV